MALKHISVSATPLLRNFSILERNSREQKLLHGTFFMGVKIGAIFLDYICQTILVSHVSVICLDEYNLIQTVFGDE